MMTLSELIDRADEVLGELRKYDISMSSKLYHRAVSALASLARGEMRDLVKQMKKFLENTD